MTRGPEQHRTPPFRVGIVGFGTSGRIFHAPFILAHPDFELVAVVTRDPAKRADLAELAPHATAVDSLDALLALDLDLVVVGSPTGLHAQHARQAVEAAVTTLVDKPVAPTAAAARDLFTLAHERGVGLTVFQNRRFDDDFLTLRGLLEQEAFGDVYRFESRFERFSPVRKAGWKTESTPAQGGGILLDLGTHLIDQAIALFGPVARVADARLAKRAATAAEDDAYLSLLHESGVTSELWMNSMAAVLGQRFRVLGTRGGFASMGLDPQEAMLKSGLLPGDADFGSEPGNGRPGRVGTLATASGDSLETRDVPLTTSDYGQFYDRVAAWMRGDADAPVTADQALAVLDVIDEARGVAER